MATRVGGKVILMGTLLLLGLASCGQQQSARDRTAEREVSGYVRGPMAVDILHRDKPVVALFVIEECFECERLQVELLRHIDRYQKSREKVEFYTFLVTADRGADLVDRLSDYQEKQQLPWPVWSDLKGVMAANYCPYRNFPCVVVTLPQKGIVYSRTRALEIHKIKRWTGEWNVRPGPFRPHP